MISATLLQFILTGASGLIAGTLCGLGLFMLINRRAARNTSLTPSNDAAMLDARFAQQKAIAHEKRQTIEDAQAMLANMETYLATLNQNIASAREQIAAKDTEHVKLLSALDERRASIENAHGSLESVAASLQSQEQETETLLTNIDKSLEEIDMLKELHESYVVKINRLTQQVQWHDSELRMLQQTAQTRSAEIEEARALLDQRDAELRRIIRERQQREIDLEHVKQTLDQIKQELKQLLQQQAQSESMSRPARSVSHRPPAEERILIPPRKQPMLPSPPIVEIGISNSQVGPDDDLTQIPGLAEFYAVQLRTNGIRTFRQLANARPDDIQRMLDIPGHFSPNIARWIEAARQRTDYDSGDGQGG